jgi:hypothetical protein
MKQEIEFRDPVVKRVVNKFVSRSDVGFEKYGITLQDDPSKMFEWLNHLQEELMDAVLYLQKAKETYTNDFMEEAFKASREIIELDDMQMGISLCSCCSSDDEKTD